MQLRRAISEVVVKGLFDGVKRARRRGNAGLRRERKRCGQSLFWAPPLSLGPGPTASTVTFAAHRQRKAKVGARSLPGTRDFVPQRSVGFPGRCFQRVAPRDWRPGSQERGAKPVRCSMALFPRLWLVRTR